MTNNILDSKSVNYDRRNALKGAVAIPLAGVPILPSISIACEDEALLALRGLEDAVEKWKMSEEDTEEFDVLWRRVEHYQDAALDSTPSTNEGAYRKLKFMIEWSYDYHTERGFFDEALEFVRRNMRVI